MKNRKLHRAAAVLASPVFFWSVLGFFILESLWIVFVAVYPMAFDEDFHFGLIKIYSQHWLPFISHQPPNANFYGPVGQNPSYLYHYLMSFPYRLIALVAHSQSLQVTYMRLINVALFAYSLWLFRKVMLRCKLTPAVTDFALLLFVLIPIVPMLAAEINYDNLTMVLVAWVCLLMLRIMDSLSRKRFPLVEVGLLAVIALLGSIVKYAFLPVMAACVLTILVLAWSAFDKSFAAAWSAARQSLLALKKSTVLVLAIAIIASLGLFSQRYLVNLAAYKSPIPRCDKILTIDDCMSYGPFNRTYTLMQTKSPEFKPNIWSYIPQWFYGMWYRTFFAVNGNVSSPSWARYETIPPLPVPSITAVGLLLASVAVIIVYSKKLYRDTYLIFLALTIVLYCAALIFDNYGAYNRAGQPIAVNGRYLLPILLPFFIIAGRAWQSALSGHSYRLKLALAGVITVLFIQGGGVLTYMINSNYAWYWPDHRTQTAGWYAHEIASKFVMLHTPIYIMPP